MLTHIYVSKSASFFGLAFIDFVLLHANVAAFMDQVLMPSLLVLCLEVHLMGSLDCRQNGGLLVYIFKPCIV